MSPWTRPPPREVREMPACWPAFRFGDDRLSSPDATTSPRRGLVVRKAAGQLVRRTGGLGGDGLAVPRDAFAPGSLATLGPPDGPGFVLGLSGPEAANAVQVVGGNGEAQEDGDLGPAEDAEEAPRPTGTGAWMG